MAPDPLPRRAGGDAKLQAQRPRRVEVLQNARQHAVRQDHLCAAAGPAVQHLLRQRPAETLLQVVLRMEPGGRRADDLHPPLERQVLAVCLVNLEPGAVDRLLGVEDQPVEVEHDGSNHEPKA